VRPLRLFARPEPIERWPKCPTGLLCASAGGGVLHDVTAIEGPERIAAPWWRACRQPTRDYFRAGISEGPTFWLYREGLWVARRCGRSGLCMASLVKGRWCRALLRACALADNMLRRPPKRDRGCGVRILSSFGIRICQMCL